MSAQRTQVSAKQNFMNLPPQQSRQAERQAPKLRYVVLMISGIFAILGVQLLLSIQVSGGAYQISSLRSEVRASQQTQQIVSEEISALIAPDTLANLATSMGMVPDNNPAYLRLSNGAVLGEPLPAAGSSAKAVHSVTAGTESHKVPTIVADVFVSLTRSSDPDSSPSPDLAPTLGSGTPSPGIEAENESLPKLISPSRFGGSIPSPVTR